MINAKEAGEKLRHMTPEERFNNIKWKVSKSTRDALDTKIREVIAWYERKVDIVLKASICRDADRDIATLLRGLWYIDIDVTSDFPAYCESYEWTTHIKFSVPE